MNAAKERVRSKILPKPDVALTAREELATLTASAEIWGRMCLTMPEFAMVGFVFAGFLTSVLHLMSKAVSSEDWFIAVNSGICLLAFGIFIIMRLIRDFRIRRNLMSQQAKMRRELNGIIPSE